MLRGRHSVMTGWDLKLIHKPRKLGLCVYLTADYSTTTQVDKIRITFLSKTNRHKI